MAKFLVLRDTFISHLGQVVKAGDTVEFEIPVVGGKPMVIGDNLERLDKPAKAKADKAPDRDADLA